jgi:hypothetical protein
MRAHILDCARRLHRSHARGDLVQLESLPEQSHSFLPDLENPLFAEWRASARCAKHIHAPAIVVRICRDAVAGAHRVLRGFVDGLADLDDVVEDGGIDQARRGHGVVLVGQRRQYLGRQLEPWSMERGDVAPVPVAIVRVMVVSLSSRALGLFGFCSKDWRVCERGNTARTYLFLQMMRLGPADCSGGAAAFFLAIALDNCLTAQGAVRRKQQYKCCRALNSRKVCKCWW